ncbi:hypothetical protein Tco_0636548, partial [Tanacetum coccineum]
VELTANSLHPMELTATLQPVSCATDI